MLMHCRSNFLSIQPLSVNKSYLSYRVLVKLQPRPQRLTEGSVGGHRRASLYFSGTQLARPLAFACHSPFPARFSVVGGWVGEEEGMNAINHFVCCLLVHHQLFVKARPPPLIITAAPTGHAHF